jgi:protein TonB
MNEFAWERLLESVVAEEANPALPDGFVERLNATDFAKENRMTGNVLTFGTMDAVRAGGQSRRTVLGALLLHAAVLALLFLQIRAMHDRQLGPLVAKGEVMLEDLPAPLRMSAKSAAGGGGQTGAAPAMRGNPPKFAQQQLMPPKIDCVEDAKLAVEPTVVADPRLQMQDSKLPELGMPNGSNVGVSLGSGGGDGIGSGHGSGYGAGNGGNAGGGPKRVGGGVLAPVVLYSPEPEFSEEARQAHTQGNVLVYLVVDEKGLPQRVRVVQGIGMGLDEKALEAVRQYRFKPAMENGRPVKVEIQIEVTFTIL